MANGKLNLMYGTHEKYEALSTYDSDTLYFVDGVVYKGDQPFGTKIEMVDALSDSGSQGILYLTPDKAMYFWDGSSWQIINVGIVGIIDDESDANDGKTVTQAALKAYVQAKISNLSTDEATEEMISAKVNEAINAAKTELTQKDEELNEKIDDTKTELQNEINSKIASVFKFKGTKATKSELESVTDATVGDVWHVDADGKEYVFVDINDDGSGEWELLGFTIDLSAYSTTEEINEAFGSILENIYTKTETDNAIKAVSDDLSGHTQDTTAHITKDERDAWNAKVDASTFNAHADNTEIHISASEREAWNKAEQNAKDYADTLITWKTIE